MKLPKLSKKQWYIAGAIALVLIAVGIYLWNERRKKRSAEQSADAAPVKPMYPEAPIAPTTVTPIPGCVTESPFPLKYGACGQNVKKLQAWLIRHHGAQLPKFGVDGKWGAETDAAVRKHILKNEPYSISEDYFKKTGMDQIKVAA